MKRVKTTPHKRTLLGLVISMMLAAPAVAEENTQFDEVVVWGTKVSSNSESLGAEDMSVKQADHMSDLLRDIPGVDVGGTHSVNQRINIRGLGETDLDIRLDGASQHANMFHHIGNLTLNPDILKSVDVEVGNNSVTQNGLSGAVYFETKNAKDLLRYNERFGARVFGGYATNDNQQGSLTAFGQLSDRVDAMIYGHYVEHKNFKDGNGEETFGAAGDVYNILGKIGFEPSVDHRFELSYDLYRDSGDYSPRPDMNGGANEGLSGELLIPTDYDRDTVTLSYVLNKQHHNGKVVVYSSQTEIDRDESKTGWERMGRASRNTATNRNTGVNATFHSDVSLIGLSNHVAYGLDYMDKNSTSKYGGKKYMDESAISTAVFVEDKVYLLDNWSVTAGLRFDDYKREAETGTDSFDDMTWALATEWNINSDWTLFASTRSLFKGPELLETFVRYQTTTYLDDNIKAETGLNTQGGVRFNKRIDDHFISSSLTLFRTDIDDYHAEEWNGAGYTIVNQGDAEYKGFEFSASYGYKQFNSKLSYAKSDNKDKTNGGPVLENERSSDMGDSIALTLDYQADSIDTIFGWTSIVVLDEDNVLEGTADKDGYNVHNLYVQWLPSQAQNLSVTFGIDNIFDEAYVSHASRTGLARGLNTDDYEPGRNVKLSAAYQF